MPASPPAAVSSAITSCCSPMMTEYTAGSKCRVKLNRVGVSARRRVLDDQAVPAVCQGRVWARSREDWTGLGGLLSLRTPIDPGHLVLARGHHRRDLGGM